MEKRCFKQTYGKWYGPTIDLEISLSQHGIIGLTNQEDKTTLFYYYDPKTSSFQSCVLSLTDIDAWFLEMTHSEQKSLLDVVGLTKEEWLSMNPIEKIIDLNMYVTVTELFGESHHKGKTIDEVMNITKYVEELLEE